MYRALLRLFLALGGAAVFAVLVALLEVRGIATALADAGDSQRPPFGVLFASELGLLSPLALGIGMAVGVVALVLQPGEAIHPLRSLEALRSGAVLDRLRVATVAPLTLVAAFGWCVACAHLARVSMGTGDAAEVGLTVGIGAIGAFVVAGAIVLAFVPPVRRLLALGSEGMPRLLDPAWTSAGALIVVVSLAAYGVHAGDTSGAGGGALGILGVFKRTELDLRPVVNVLVIAIGAFVAPIAFTGPAGSERSGRPNAREGAAAGAGLLLQIAFVVLCIRASSNLGDEPIVVRSIENHAPAGKLALAALRRATDRDRDGFSAKFAGGDCDDRDPRINPNALDIPGNGIDEDCSGADLPIVAPAPTTVTSADAAPAKPKRSYNVILLTVDTLRPNLGFMNYGKPTSPNLDKLAEKSTVFERAYSMASYTGKSVGPMLIGKYPSETVTDFSHFNTYASANVLVAERGRDAGYRTFAGMCHWYFKRSSGLAQGFDVWDISAIPPGMTDNDTSISSDRLADLALKLLADPRNVLGVKESDDAADAGATSNEAVADAGAANDAGEAAGESGPHRFFAWFHFFDPHAQYVAHREAPDFSGEKGGIAQSRALYDQEIWYTDKHIGRVLDYVASQPWAEDTAIVMTADHGEAFYEHGMLFHGSEIWNELVHVPLFVYVPGAEPRRVSVNRSHIDVAPTIIELMGLPVPDDGSLRGKSLLDDVHLAKDGEHEERDVYVDMPAGPFNGVRRALISGPSPGMKLIHFGGGNYQLFDLENDPAEKKDLSSDKEKRAAAIARMNEFRGGLKEIEVKPK